MFLFLWLFLFFRISCFYFRSVHFLSLATSSSLENIHLLGSGASHFIRSLCVAKRICCKRREGRKKENPRAQWYFNWFYRGRPFTFVLVVLRRCPLMMWEDLWENRTNISVIQLMNSVKSSFYSLFLCQKLELLSGFAFFFVFFPRDNFRNNNSS